VRFFWGLLFLVGVISGGCKGPETANPSQGAGVPPNAALPVATGPVAAPPVPTYPAAPSPTTCPIGMPAIANCGVLNCYASNGNLLLRTECLGTDGLQHDSEIVIDSCGGLLPVQNCGGVLRCAGSCQEQPVAVPPPPPVYVPTPAPPPVYVPVPVYVPTPPEGRPPEGRPPEGRPPEGRPPEGRPPQPPATGCPIGDKDYPGGCDLKCLQQQNRWYLSGKCRGTKGQLDASIFFDTCSRGEKIENCDGELRCGDCPKNSEHNGHNGHNGHMKTAG